MVNPILGVIGDVGYSKVIAKYEIPTIRFNNPETFEAAKRWDWKSLPLFYLISSDYYNSDLYEFEHLLMLNQIAQEGDAFYDLRPKKSPFPFIIRFAEKWQTFDQRLTGLSYALENSHFGTVKYLEDFLEKVKNFDEKELETIQKYIHKPDLVEQVIDLTPRVIKVISRPED